MTDDCAWCDLDDLPLRECVHGREAERRAAIRTSVVEVSPRGVAHLPGCTHKEDDDFSLWGRIGEADAWRRLGNGEQIEAARDDGATVPVERRCLDCIESASLH